MAERCEASHRITNSQNLFTNHWVVFAQAGWFPTYTLGEDMALALEIQSKGWRGAYLQVTDFISIYFIDVVWQRMAILVGTVITNRGPVI